MLHTSACFHLWSFVSLVFQNTHSYFLFASVSMCVSTVCSCVCVVPFQVALTCSVHPTVRLKRTSQSLTACAPPPLSPLVLTHVLVSLMTRSLCGFPCVCRYVPAGHRHTCLVFVCKCPQIRAKMVSIFSTADAVIIANHIKMPICSDLVPLL